MLLRALGSDSRAPESARTSETWYDACMKSLLFALLLVAPISVSAQELHQDIQEVWRAEVVNITDSRTEIIPGTETPSEIQTLEVRLLEGDRAGTTITFENDYIQLEEGQTFYLNHMVTVEGDEFYTVREVDRFVPMLIIIALFVTVVLFFGGMQGMRSLLSLAGSLIIIVYVLIPSLLKGFPPIPTSIAIASAILFCAIFFTHGFNRRSLIAYAGTIIAVGLTGILAFVSVDTAGLTGFSADESVYLNLSTGGTLNFVGLLLAGIIIGALGVLDDIAITQVAVVRELLSVADKISRREIYHRALRVGREHVGALVNTLVLAYAGAALPLLLLFSLSDGDTIAILNREVFATEIVRALVGSIGLVLTVPITTLLAVTFLRSDAEAPESTMHHHLH